jgi:hypothetical protein
LSVCEESEANARLRVECAMIGLFFCMLRSIPIRAKRRGLQAHCGLFNNSPMGRITVAGLLALGIYGGAEAAFGRVVTPSPHDARLAG